MNFPKLQPGDVFGTRNPMALGRMINFIQKLWSKDSASKYSHSGIIIDEDGATFESLWTLNTGNLFKAYTGKEIIVARPISKYDKAKLLTRKEKYTAVKKIIVEHKGQWYPYWRLTLQLIPPLAKIVWFNRPVCSELVAKYLWYIKARHHQWAGTNPDTLADEWRIWKNFEVIFEGKLGG